MQGFLGFFFPAENADYKPVLTYGIFCFIGYNYNQ